MIGSLKGTVGSVEVETALIEVGGVGYEIYGTARTLQNLVVGEAAALSIETIVREDFIKLYGFENAAERQSFRLLQSVQGVGAKHALAILQVLPPEDLYDAIAAEDTTAVSRAHGVGKKIAQRIVTELQSKLGALAGSAGAGLTVAARNTAAPTSARVEASASADAVSALANLGYDGVEARRAVAAAANAVGVDAEVGVLIKQALKELAA